jgi:hypothetical protein
LTLFSTLSPDGQPMFLASLSNVQGGRVHHEFIRSEEELQRFLKEYDHPGRALYRTVAQLREEEEAFHQARNSWRRKDNVADTVWIWGEVDFKDHPDIEPDEIAQRLLAMEPAATKIVHSGHGLHAYWRLAEREDASPGEGQRRIEEVLRPACAHIGGDPHVAETSRLMRLPGSHNTRVPGEKLPVEIVHHTPEVMYDLGVLEDAFLAGTPVMPAPKKQESQAGKGANGNIYVPPKDGPIETDAELEAMRFRGDPPIHFTQLRVAAKLISAGHMVEHVVERILLATKKAVQDEEEAKTWSWPQEGAAIAGMCLDWINKRMKEDGEDLSHTLPDKLYTEWQQRREKGLRPVITYNAAEAGYHVRGYPWERPKKPLCAAVVVDAPPLAAEARPKEEERARARRRVTIFSSSGFTAGFVPPDYLVDGILQRRFLYSLTGPTGHGKTCVLLLIAAHVAQGKELGSNMVGQGRVIVLAGENPDDVRMRWIAMSEHLDFDPNEIGVDFLPGVFPIAEMKSAIEQRAQELGCKYALVIVDTSAAYFSGAEENSNVQLGKHARELRTLVEVPGGPTVLVSCHPTKNADLDNLLPRGGGAFLAEVDGNLICRKSGGEDVTEMHWHGKFRGPDFNPQAFELRQVTTAKLVDSSGKMIPTILAAPLDEFSHSGKRAESRGQEDKVLALLVGKEGLSLALIAQRAGWLTKAGEPNKAKTQRVVNRLRDANLVKHDRGEWCLTDAGSKAAKKAEGRKL